jgi:dienelactone hydrolase
VRLGGQLFTGGSTWVVLAHMGRPGDSMVDWLPAAASLVRKGYTVLVFNRRGVCPGGAAGCSEGVDDYATSWRDVVGADSFARRNGARRIVLGGASIGAMATLRAVLRRDLDAAGIIWFGGLLNASGYRFTKSEVQNLATPLLALSTREDPYAAAASAG